MSIVECELSWHRVSFPFHPICSGKRKRVKFSCIQLNSFSLSPLQCKYLKRILSLQPNKTVARQRYTLFVIYLVSFRLCLVSLLLLVGELGSTSWTTFHLTSHPPVVSRTIHWENNSEMTSWGNWTWSPVRKAMSVLETLNVLLVLFGKDAYQIIGCGIRTTDSDVITCVRCWVLRWTIICNAVSPPLITHIPKF